MFLDLLFGVFIVLVMVWECFMIMNIVNVRVGVVVLWVLGELGLVIVVIFIILFLYI